MARPFCRGAVGGALVFLRRGRNQYRLHQGRQHRSGIDCPYGKARRESGKWPAN